MPRPRAPEVRAALAALALAALPLRAQTVVELQAGGTSLYDAYGLYGNLYTRTFDGWAGVGYADGFRFGARLQTSFRKDTLSLGSDVVLQQYPTDIFGFGVNILAQGARFTLVRPKTVASLFGGAASSAVGNQFFQAFRFEDPFGALTVRHRAHPFVTLGLNAVAARRQTAIGSLEVRPAREVALALSGGIGADRGYGAVSVHARHRTVGVRASYVLNGGTFRRAALPFPVQSEADRENILVDWEPFRDIGLSLGRQNFVQDSGAGGTPIRATGNSVLLSARRLGFRLQGGLYDTRSQGLSNLSSYLGLGRELGFLDIETFVLRSDPSVGRTTTTPIVNLRERVSRRVRLLQQLSWSDGRPTIQFGGDFITPIGDLGLSYQIVQQPFEPLDPFRSVLSLSARLQLGKYSTSLNTIILPDGSVNYLANGSTFLYFGQFGGVQPGQVSGRIERFVIRGRVLDEAGRPVDGAALDFEGDYAFSNPAGEFLIRVGRPRRYALVVRTDEFLLPGQWEVVSAPAEVQALTEERAMNVDVVLRRVGAPPPAPVDSVAPADTLVRPAVPADTTPPPPPPPADADGDGITDPADRCPGTPPGQPVDSEGCPPFIPVGESRVTFDAVIFNTGSAIMRPSSFPVLDAAVAALRARPELVLSIEGHTDNRGSAAFNQRLSQARAEAVRRYLVQAGVPANRIVAIGYGATRPIGDNATAEGRRQNRRVEFVRLE